MAFLPYFGAVFLAISSFFPSVLSATVPASGNGPTRFELSITWEKGSPDGHEREMFKVNGQFPGPHLEINEGDDVVILVKNDSPFNTSLHYHGIEMLETPWSDGVPGLTQTHIQPGCAFTYKWKATQHGTFFYHSHSQSQIDDGLYGPLTIHPKSTRPRPFNMITDNPVSLYAMEKAQEKRVSVMLSDWRQIISDKEWEISMESHIEHPCFDSLLVNGKGSVNCVPAEKQAGLMTAGQKDLLSVAPNATLTDKSCLPPEAIAKILTAPDALPVNLNVIPNGIFSGCQETEGSIDIIEVTKDKCVVEQWVMLDLIGNLALATVQVSVDELEMWVVAADSNFIKPVAVHSIGIANGQRYTVLVRLEEPKKYTLRVASTSDPQILYGTSILDFKVAGRDQNPAPTIPWINERGVNLTSNVVFFDPNAVKPFLPEPIPRDADATYKFVLQVDKNNNLWALNTTHRPDDLESAATPLLFAPQPGLQDNHTVTVPDSASWVDYIFQVPVGQPPHPIHVHGRHFYVVGQGTGNFTWDSVADAARDAPESFNLVDPPLRDTFPTAGSVPEASWLVIRRRSDNPGVWLLHCHIQSHMQGGMSVVIQEGLAKLPAIPVEYEEGGCGI
ncbi:multicopper oxidase [Xylariomycetidae sp. FL2044]|nr:multicopper oxidase [Xylariomycetidae sp. FL2044]